MTTTLAARWRSWAPYLLSVLRIIAAFVFMQFGSAKLVAIPAAIMPGGGTAPLTSLP
jgi:putative oxidoreductase